MGVAVRHGPRSLMSQGLRWSIGAQLGPEAPAGSMQAPLLKSSGPEKDLEDQKRQAGATGAFAIYRSDGFEAGGITIH